MIKNVHESRERAEPTTQKNGENKHLRSNSERYVEHTAEGLKTCQTHQLVDVLNTDHKVVAVFLESNRIFAISDRVLGWSVRRQGCGDQTVDKQFTSKVANGRW